MSLCRSCKAEIVWAISEQGKPAPVDAQPVAGGTILLRHLEVGQPPVAHVTSAEERTELAGVTGPEPFVLFVSHFATCPSAAQWRRP